MPAELEKRLRAEAIKRRMSNKRADAYVYGTMRKQGWIPSRETKTDGNKHD